MVFYQEPRNNKAAKSGGGIRKILVELIMNDCFMFYNKTLSLKCFILVFDIVDVFLYFNNFKV